MQTEFVIENIHIKRGLKVENICEQSLGRPVLLFKKTVALLRMNHYEQGYEQNEWMNKANCQFLSSTSPVNCALKRTLLAQFPLFPVLFTLAWITSSILYVAFSHSSYVSLSSHTGTFPVLCSLFSIFSLDDSLSFFLCCMRWHSLKCSHRCSQPASSRCEMIVALCKSFVSLAEAICLDGYEKYCRPVKCVQERICFLLETTKERDLAAWRCHLVLCWVGREGKRELAATTELFLQQKSLLTKGYA